MRRNSAPYAPLTFRRRVLLLRPFRTVRLNLVGWSALLAAMLALAGLAGAITDQIWFGVVVAGMVLVGAVVTDRGRWRNSCLSLGVDSEELAQRLVQALTAQGIAANAEAHQWDDEEEVQHSVKVRQRDQRAASAAQERLGDGG